MDCKTALDIMNGHISPVNDAVWEEVGIHLDSCHSCDAQFRSGDVIEEQIAEEMLSVIVPANLRTNLFALLNLPADQSSSALKPQDLIATESTSDVDIFSASKLPTEINPTEINPTVLPQNREENHTANTTQKPQESVSRRTAIWRGVSVITALGLIACFTFLMTRTEPRQLLSVGELTQIVVDRSWDSFPAFQASSHFDPDRTQQVWEWQQTPQMALTGPKGFRPASHTEDVMAAYAVSCRLSSQLSTNGYLLVIPHDQLSIIPPQGDFSTQIPSYLSGSQGQFASVAWSDGEVAYVLLLHEVPGGGDLFQQLHRSLHQFAA